MEVTEAEMTLLFVYGSLKQGYPNAHVNGGERIPGVFRTRQTLPMLLLGDGHVPCLVLSPGGGHQVRGELYRLDDASLAAVDKLERVGEADGYLRQTIEVEDVASELPGPITAFAYVKLPEQLPAQAQRIGPLLEYSLEHAKRLYW